MYGCELLLLLLNMVGESWNISPALSLNCTLVRAGDDLRCAPGLLERIGTVVAVSVSSRSSLLPVLLPLRLLCILLLLSLRSGDDVDSRRLRLLLRLRSERSRLLLLDDLP